MVPFLVNFFYCAGVKLSICTVDRLTKCPFLKSLWIRLFQHFQIISRELLYFLLVISFYFTYLFFNINVNYLCIFPLSFLNQEAFSEFAYIFHGEKLQTQRVQRFLFFQFFETGQHFLQCDLNIFFQFLEFLLFGLICFGEGQNKVDFHLVFLVFDDGSILLFDGGFFRFNDVLVLGGYGFVHSLINKKAKRLQKDGYRDIKYKQCDISCGQSLFLLGEFVIAAFVHVSASVIDLNFNGIDADPLVILEGLLNVSQTKRTFIFIQLTNRNTKFITFGLQVPVPILPLFHPYLFLPPFLFSTVRIFLIFLERPYLRHYVLIYVLVQQLLIYIPFSAFTATQRTCHLQLLKNLYVTLALLPCLMNLFTWSLPCYLLRWVFGFLIGLLSASKFFLVFSVIVGSGQIVGLAGGQMELYLFRSHFQSILIVVFDGRNGLGFETFVDVDSSSMIDVVLHLLEEERVNSSQPKLPKYFYLLQFRQASLCPQ